MQLKHLILSIFLVFKHSKNIKETTNTHILFFTVVFTLTPPQLYAYKQ
jgi:hypothetical protein